MTTAAPTPMPLGAFSMSLAVKDVAVSHAFYEKLGFSVIAGDPKGNMVILRNGETAIGLFHGMIERNSLTFNPGWDAQCRTVEGFTDVRELQRRLRSAGIEPVVVADEGTTGPAHVVLIDPDGNPVLLDQHV